jgi:hypothetical protein
MVGLTLLSLGNTPVDGSRSREIRSIVSYMLRQVENMPSDDITSQTGTQLQNKIGRHAHTFFATVFLCERSGPFELRSIINQIQAGAVTGETLLWKQGMTGWEKAGKFGELEAALRATPPPLPK